MPADGAILGKPALDHKLWQAILGCCLTEIAQSGAVFRTRHSQHAGEQQMSDTGLVTIESAHSFDATLGRLQEVLRAAKLTVFAQFDHAAAAADVGLTLRPTTVVVCGNRA